MVTDRELTWSDYLDIILNRYKDKPDNFKISIGDWEKDCDGWPEFHAFMQMQIGDLRKFRELE